MSNYVLRVPNIHEGKHNLFEYQVLKNLTNLIGNVVLWINLEPQS